MGSVSEKVTVEAEGVTLQTEKTDVHTEITAKAILEMPLNQYRNYQTLINLVPGATPGVIPERHCGYAGTGSEHQHQRHEPEQQQYPRGWRC